jgi:hypothetical protein
VFTTAEEGPSFSDALVSWVLYYHQLLQVSLTKKNEVKKVFKRVKAAGGTALKYSRWDGEKENYLHYTPSS